MNLNKFELVASDRNRRGCMTLTAVKILLLLSMLEAIVLFVANLAALKIWSLNIPYPAEFWPIKAWQWYKIPVDAGIWLFPISYMVGDLIVHWFGEKIANYIAYVSALFASVVAGIFWLIVFLPDYAGADNSAFVIVQQSTGRVFLASVAGFLASQVVNNRCFELWRRLGGGYQECAWKSSLIAHVVDTLIFEVMAFLGKLSLSEFWTQAIFAYAAGIAIERLTLFISKRLVRRLDKTLPDVGWMR